MRPPVTDDPHKPLREDVRLLGELLGRTLRTLEGDPLFHTVERVRALAKEARGGSDAAFETLARELSGMPVDAALPVARAFAHFLHLANVAEQHHRVRRRRAYQRDPGASPQRGSCDEAFARLIADGVSPERLHDAVCKLRIELVLTAHPTQIARRTLVQKYNRIAAALAAQDREDSTLPERAEIEATLLREIMSAWGTSEVRAERPTPLDEVRSGLIVFEQSLWEALPLYLRGVDRALRATTGGRLPRDSTPIRFGSWIGGDRDGNPSVTPEVTRRACLLSRWVATELYLREIDLLRDELSIGAATPELRALVGDTPEPYRALLRSVRDRLRATREWIERSLAAAADMAPSADAYLEPDELGAALRLCADSLERSGFRELAEGRLADVLRRLAAFEMTLARLDIRQEASRHAEAIAAIAQRYGLGSYADWDEPARANFLVAELEAGRLRLSSDIEGSPEVRDVLDTFRTMAALRRSSLGAYVITMASEASDVLAVAVLQRMAGIADPLCIVPLFETSHDLERASAVLDALFSMPIYRRSIHDRQEVMIGYSDSAKDVGRLAAGWKLYTAQEGVIASGRRHGVELTLFHGRGGSIGRGGGPTYLAIMSQAPGSISGTMRVTEQGEMLQTLFGLPEIALRTMDVYTTATLEAWLRPPSVPTPEWRAQMDALADEARTAYRGVVYDDPAFLEYFRLATPERELADMNIGSRPARRKADAGVASLRAIPWQFAWTQTRLMLGAWLGIEDALERASARGEADRLHQMYRQWPHFRSSIDLIATVLAEAEARIAAEYDRRLVPPALQAVGADLRSRLHRAVASVLAVTERQDLLETNTVLRRSIDVRNPYVDPLNLVQVELLRRLRAADDDTVRAALLVTINGVAAGMRNTG